jgi:purine-binding chemotaxis protein CheW
MMTVGAANADQLVADYLAVLLTPAAQAAPLQVVTFDPWRQGNGAAAQGEPPRYLLCRAAGVRLAVPMRTVRHVLPMPPLVVAGNDRPPCLGRWRHPGGEARVADLAAVLAPDMAGAAATSLVLLADRAWALACVVDEEPVHLEHEAIQWRPGATTRPWLAGMARELSCGVLDTLALADMLDMMMEGA